MKLDEHGFPVGAGNDKALEQKMTRPLGHGMTSHESGMTMFTNPSQGWRGTDSGLN